MNAFILYLYGCFFAFIINIIHCYIYIKGIKQRDRKLWFIIAVFISSSILMTILSWLGVFYVIMSLNARKDEANYKKGKTNGKYNYTDFEVLERQ